MSSGADLTDADKWDRLGRQLIFFACLQGFAVAFAIGVSTFESFISAQVEKREKRILCFGARRGEIPWMEAIIRFRDAHHHAVSIVVYGLLSTFDLIFFVTFVARFNTKSFPTWTKIVEPIGVSIFAANYISRFLSARSKLTFVFKPKSVFDVLTIASSAFSQWANFYLCLGFFRLELLLSHVRRIPLQPIRSRVLREIIVLLSGVLVFVLQFACVILIVETLGDIPGIDYQDDEWTLSNSIYYVIVTLSTVGYGDFYATTWFGRLIMVNAIVVGIVIFGAQSSELVEIISTDNKGLGRFTNADRSDFVVLLGDLDVDLVSEFVSSLMDNPYSDRYMTVVILADTEEEFNSLRDNFKLDKNRTDREGSVHRVAVYRGNQLRNEDLERIQIQNALSVFVIGPLVVDESLVDYMDMYHLVTAVSVRRYLKSTQNELGLEREVPIKVTTSKRSNVVANRHPLLLERESRTEILSYDSTTMKLLALAAMAPGASTILTNLLVPRREFSDVDMSDQPLWVSEYLSGAECTINVVTPREQFCRKSFWAVYEELLALVPGAILLGYVQSNGWVCIAPDTRGAYIPETASLVVVSHGKAALGEIGTVHRTRVGRRTRRETGTPLVIQISVGSLLRGYSRVQVQIVGVFYQDADIEGDHGEESETKSDGTEVVVETNYVAVRKDRDFVMYRAVSLFRDEVEKFEKIQIRCYGCRGEEEEGNLLATTTIKSNELSIIMLDPKRKAQGQDEDPYATESAEQYSQSSNASFRRFQTLNKGSATPIMKKQLTVVLRGASAPSIAAGDSKEDGKDAGKDDAKVDPTSGDREGKSVYSGSATVVIRRVRLRKRQARGIETLLSRRNRAALEQSSATRRERTRREEYSKVETADGFTEDGRFRYMINLYSGKRELLKTAGGGFAAMNHHIVLFDPDPEELLYLLRPLKSRDKFLGKKNGSCIIIVHQMKASEIASAVLPFVDLLSNVFWICEKMRTAAFFLQIRMHKARQVIVAPRLADMHDQVDEGGTLLQDAPSMFLAVRIKTFLNGREKRGGRYVPVSVAIHSRDTLNLLDYNENTHRFLHPLYAEGVVIADSFPQMLLLTSVWNPKVVPVVEAIMAARKAQILGAPVSWLRGCGFKGKCWSDVRKYMMHKSRLAVPFAIYRTRSAEKDDEGNTRRYCFTKPPNDNKLLESDIIIAFARKQIREFKCRVSVSPGPTGVGTRGTMRPDTLRLPQAAYSMPTLSEQKAGRERKRRSPEVELRPIATNVTKPRPIVTN